MPSSLFQRVLLPVASEDDVRTTCSVVRPYLQRADGVAIGVHVIEHKEGSVRAAPIDARVEDSEHILELVRDDLGDRVAETRTAHGPDITAAIFETATDTDASAIVFTPRGGSRWVRLLTGDVADSLVTNAELPVIVLPNEQEG
jgi:nucleotide-binding universal stress UspA family protein